jgi:triphosphoribosyl-dephospho-CoA synthase
VKRLTDDEIAWAAQLACLYEASIEKPGNVSPGVSFSDMRYEDFVTSAVAIGPALRDAGRATVGETIGRAVRDTRRLVAVNTNLGLILLLAPLATAAARVPASGGDLRTALAAVLGALTVQDAVLTYGAIRAAGPAGMGASARHDVRAPEVTVTLLEAMDEARRRDAIAREYVTGFRLSFSIGADTILRCWREGARFSEAVLTAFLTLLAETPDTLIARKNGLAVAEDVSRRAAEVLAAGGALDGKGRAGLRALTRELRDEAHALNPGTTADLVAASLFIALTEGGLLGEVSALTDRW